MANIAADIDEVRDVILALMPRLHTALVKRECEGCTIYNLVAPTRAQRENTEDRLSQFSYGNIICRHLQN